MARHMMLEIKEGTISDTLRSFFSELLIQKHLDALLLPLELPTRANVVPTLVTDREKLAYACFYSPVMPVNAARIISEMTRVTPSGKKLGVVLKNCEIRALIELVKLRQASLENVTIFGIDCVGTYPVSTYAEKVAQGTSPAESLLSRVAGGEEDDEIRKSCKICAFPFPQHADVIIELLNHNLTQEVGITIVTERGERALKGVELKENTQPEKRERKVDELNQLQHRKREQFFKEEASRFQGIEQLMAVFSSCIRCYNCRTVCPACYCRECFFDSPTFEMEADRYLGWAEARGAVRMPSNTLFFHLTRMAHMTTCCVGCGLCSEACPNNIPVAEVFQLAAREVQKDLDYIPGRNLDEPLPLSTFREDELKELGGD